MPQHVFRLAPQRVLVEQIRLLTGNVGASVVPTLVLSSVLVWSLRVESNAWSLPAWAAFVIASKLLNAVHAHLVLRKGINPDGLRGLLTTLMALNALDGLAWGALPWVSMDQSSVAGQVLVIAVMAGVTSNAMSVLSPVLPVFLAFSFCAVTTLAVKLFWMSNPEYHMLAYIAVLYVVTNVVQGRVAAIAARAAIDLRFENLDLIGRLQDETQKARAAHIEAEQANLAKSKFLAAASHDLRQPIHALGLFLEVIGKGELSPMQHTMLGNALNTTKASSEMLNTLLDFSRIEAGVVEPQKHAFRLQDVITRVESELAPLAVDKGLVFRTRETQAIVQSDPVLVELVLRNLVSNAIRYTHAGGVLVGCRRRENHTVLEVWDTGIGIDTHQLQEVFKEFHQLGNPERDRNKGLGLGLAIVDGLVRVLDCKLSVASRPGRGSVFRVLLPNALLTRVRPVAGHALVPLTHGLNLQVLVIDDDEAVRIGMEHLLHTWGCSCISVESIDQALQAVTTFVPDLVICDYRLRESHNGAEAIGLLRAQLGAEVPALLITGDTAPERIREAKASGIPLLHKPVPPLVLRQQLATLVGPKSAPPDFPG